MNRRKCYVCVDLFMYQYVCAGIQAVSALDVYSTEDVGEELMPSSKYPSDHLSIAADLQLLW
jgi:hypothetical protein